MPAQNRAITKAPPEQLTTVIDGQRCQVQIIQRDTAPAQYQTSKSQGQLPAPMSLPKLPSILPLTLSAIIALSFLVAASMFSISLTAYSNSVDRVDRTRSFIQVDQ